MSEDELYKNGCHCFTSDTTEKIALLEYDVTVISNEVTNYNGSFFDIFNNSESLSVVNSIRDLAEVVGSIPSGSYWVAIVSGVTGALVASGSAILFNSIYLKYQRKRAVIRHLCTVSMEYLSSFEDAAIKYWAQDKTLSNKYDMEFLEIKIKSIFTVLRVTLSDLSELTSEDEKKEIIQFNSKVFDLATGDGFEGASRSADKKRTAQISKACSKLKAKIIKYSSPI